MRKIDPKKAHATNLFLEEYQKASPSSGPAEKRTRREERDRILRAVEAVTVQMDHTVKKASVRRWGHQALIDHKLGRRKGLTSQQRLERCHGLAALGSAFVLSILMIPALGGVGLACVVWIYGSRLKYVLLEMPFSKRSDGLLLGSAAVLCLLLSIGAFVCIGKLLVALSILTSGWGVVLALAANLEPQRARGFYNAGLLLGALGVYLTLVSAYQEIPTPAL